jgi:hypothetical protein
MHLLSSVAEITRGALEVLKGNKIGSYQSKWRNLGKTRNLSG